MLVSYVALFTGALILSFLLAFPVRRFALWANVVDKPEKRKMHQIPIPLMGGVGIFVSFTVMSLAALLLRQDLRTVAPGPWFGLMMGALLILILGIYDDVKGLTPRQKFAGQALAAIMVVSTGTGMQLLTNPLGDSFEIGWLGGPLAVLWIVGVINAVNLIDGLDGLAVGTGSIAALGLFAVAIPGQPFVAVMCLLLAGSLLGFLYHNFYPARIFLGDSGSMFIGYMLSVIGLMGSYKATTATVLFLPIIVLGVPLFDTMFAIFRRARRRVNPFKADREHIHHRLVRIGLHHRNVVLVLYFICAYLALTAYAIVRIPYQTAFVFLVLLTMGGIIGLRTLRFIEERLELSLEAAEAAPAPAARETVPVRNGNGNGHAAKRLSWLPAARGRGQGRRDTACETLVCEVGGFRDDFGEPQEIEKICDDLTSMLSRRVHVSSVAAHATRRGFLMILIRTEELKPPLAALARDGVAWYLAEHAEAFGGESFPAMRWIETGVRVTGSVAPQAPAQRAEKNLEPAAHPLTKEPAGLAG